MFPGRNLQKHCKQGQSFNKQKGIVFSLLCVLVAQLCLTLCDPVGCGPQGFSVLGILQNTGVSSHSLLQGLFPTQGLDPGLLHFRQILYCLSHQGSPPLNLSCRCCGDVVKGSVYPQAIFILRWFCLSSVHSSSISAHLSTLN